MGTNTPGQPKHLKPAERCIQCSKSLTETDGQMVVAGRIGAVSVNPRVNHPNEEDIYYRRETIAGTTTEVAIRGPKEVWSDAHFEMAYRLVSSGSRPWYCQQCGKYTCKKCGAPLNWCYGADVLHPDGTVGHQAIFGANLGCSNSSCEDYKPFGENHKQEMPHE